MELLEKCREILKENTQDTENLEAWVVGGAVRDDMLDKEPKDFDFVVIDETKQSMKKRGFNKIEAQSFPVFQDSLGHEYSLPRTEKSTGKGYHDFKIQTENVSLEEDLNRRDFTINAIARRISDGVYDYPVAVEDNYQAHAVKDLKEGTIRHITEAFEEDPVRIMRMARFASRLPDFEISPQTQLIAIENVDKLGNVPGERIGEEVHKAMKQAEEPTRFWDVLKKSGALEVIAPKLDELSEVSAGPEKHHGEGDAWTHTMMVMEEMQEIDANNHDKLMMALVHDIGKVETRNEENTGGHDKLGEPLAENLAENLRLSNEYKEKMKDACREHMRIFNVDQMQKHSMRESKVIELVERLDHAKGATQEELIDLAKADNRGREAEVPVDLSSFDRIEERLGAAREAINTVDAQYVADQRDKEIDDFDGEALGQTITNDRVHHMKKLQ